ncbi:uncharacterized protein LOC144884332 isoform X1 [Branchiostoma floridae x Branchiostoma japonicum]
MISLGVVDRSISRSMLVFDSRAVHGMQKTLRTAVATETFEFRLLLVRTVLFRHSTIMENRPEISQGLVEKADELGRYFNLATNSMELQIQSDTGGRTHLESHSTEAGDQTRPEKLHKCEECSRHFTKQCLLKRHMQRVHTKEKPFHCDHEGCDQQFRLFVELKRHTRVHAKPFQCQECDKQFLRLGLLKKHMVSHSDQTPFQCDHEGCGKQFRRKGELKKHLVTHTDVKPYQCEVCGKQSRLMGDLKKHMLTHTGEKPHRCEECGKQFTQTASLKKHMRSHTGEKPFQCEKCGMQFTQMGSLKVHARTHTDEKPYVCETCGKRCRQLSNLKEHMMTHTGEKPYTCQVCGRQVRHMSALKKHIMRNHASKQV